MGSIITPCPSDRDIQNACIEIILAANITPQSTLTADAAAGTTSLVVSDPTQFTAGGVLVFNDGQPEGTLGMVAVRQDWTGKNPVMLDFAGQPHPSLQHTHSVGCVVYTNLFPETPNNVDGMLTGTNSLVYLGVTEERSYRMGGMMNEQTHLVHLEYMRRMMQPGVVLNSNIWAMQQQDRCRADMEVIRQIFCTNPHLVAPGGAIIAIDFGDPMNPSKEQFIKNYHQIVVSTTIHEFGCAAEFSIRATREIFSA